jgi:hypothetical protein
LSFSRKNKIYFSNDFPFSLELKRKDYFHDYKVTSQFIQNTPSRRPSGSSAPDCNRVLLIPMKEAAAVTGPDWIGSLVDPAAIRQATRQTYRTICCAWRQVMGLLWAVFSLAPQSQLIF